MEWAEVATYLSMAMTVSKAPAVFPNGWKKYICKRQPMRDGLLTAGQIGENLRNPSPTPGVHSDSRPSSR